MKVYVVGYYERGSYQPMCAVSSLKKAAQRVLLEVDESGPGQYTAHEFHLDGLPEDEWAWSNENESWVRVER